MIESGSDGIPFVKSTMQFSWICDDCNTFNVTSESSYRFYGDLVECKNCEHCFRLKLPWE